MKTISSVVMMLVGFLSTASVTAADQYETISERDAWKANYDAASKSIQSDGRMGEAGADGAAVGAAVNQIIHENRSQYINEAEKQNNERQNCLNCTAK